MNDYTANVARYNFKKNGQFIEQDNLSFEQLKQIITKKESIFPKYKWFLNIIQKNRNAVHAYRDRDIDNYECFLKMLVTYEGFLRNIDGSVPYP